MFSWLSTNYILIRNFNWKRKRKEAWRISEKKNFFSNRNKTETTTCKQGRLTFSKSNRPLVVCRVLWRDRQNETMKLEFSCGALWESSSLRASVLTEMWYQLQATLKKRTRKKHLFTLTEVWKIHEKERKQPYFDRKRRYMRRLCLLIPVPLRSMLLSTVVGAVEWEKCANVDSRYKITWKSFRSVKAQKGGSL